MRWLLRIVKQLGCVHLMLRVTEGKRIYLACPYCGKETRGWDV